MGRIFISHQNNPADNAWAAKVHAWIKDQKGIRGFLDFDVEDGIKAGEEWEKKIYASMNAAQVVIAIVSKDWLESSWCMSEARMARLLGRKLILIITEKCEVPFRATQSIRLEKHGEQRAFEELREALQTTHNPPARPYPGLATFSQEDAAVFFGREDETKKLENQLESLFEGRPETERLLLLLGASGSGKSSLMRAGLLPGFEERKAHHAIRPIIPRGDPLGELAVALATGPLGHGTTDDAARTVLDKIAEHAPGCERILLPIDQAEELLRGDHSRFFDVLKVVLERGNGRIIALMTMRSDFLNAFQQSGLIGTGTPLPYDTYTLDPLPQERLPDIIQKPAEIYGVTFEEGLVARIMADHGGPDALPLLAFFLSEFWTPQYIKDGRLEIPEYEHSGGIDGALKGAVEEALNRCAKVKPEETDAPKLLNELREIFLGHLVAVSAGSGEAVRRRTAAGTLTERQVALLKEFARKRLLIERDGTWEVTHEALLRQWEDLKAWIDAAREDLVAIDRIEAAAAHWDDAGRREEDLTHSGSRLSEARGLLTNPRYADRLDETARLYLTACQQKETELYEKEKQLREEAQRERDRARQGEGRARRFTRLAAMVALVALAASGFAYWQWGEARNQTAEALKSQRLGLAALSTSELRSGRATDAAILALSAWPRRPDPAVTLSDYSVVLRALTEAGVALREELRMIGHQHWVWSAAFSPDGTRIVSASWDFTLQLWDAETGTPIGAPLSGHEKPVMSVTYSPDGTRIVSGSADGTLRLWDAQTGSEVGSPLTGHQATVWSVAYSPDGAQIASASADGTVRRWDARTGAPTGEPMLGHTGGVMSVAFSGDGSRLVSGDGDGTIRFWDASTGAAIGDPLKAHEDTVWSVAYSPEGSRIVSSSRDVTVQLWDLAQDAPVSQELEGHEGTVNSLAFSPDGRKVAGGGEDGRIRLWDTRTGRAIGSAMGGHEGTVYEVAFSPDGRRLVSAGSDATVRLWVLGDGMQLIDFGEVHALAYSPDGTRIASGTSNGTLQLWDVQSGAPVGPPISAHETSVEAIAYSTDGTRIVSAGNGSALRLWDAETGAPVGVPMSNSGLTYSVAFSPDGTRVVSAGTDRAVRLWDATTGNQIGNPMLGHSQPILSVAFSPDGTRIASASHDTTLRIWDVETGVSSEPLEHEGAVAAVAFSPDGTRIVTGDSEGKLQLWDAHTGVAVGPDFLGHWGRVNSVAFSPDGKHIVSGGSDSLNVLWDVTTGQSVGLPRAAHEGTVLSVAFSPDGKSVASGGFDQTIQVYTIEPEDRTIFEIVCDRLPELDTPEIALEYGLELGEPICSGEEPLPIPKGRSQ